jgi:hypothetical protein
MDWQASLNIGCLTVNHGTDGMWLTSQRMLPKGMEGGGTYVHWKPQF